MGYDLNLIEGEVDEELICGHCKDVLEKPVQLTPCEHMFCVNCIKKCLEKQLICPIDGKPIIRTQIKAVPKLVTNFISKLKIRCNFNGCSSVVSLDQFSDHIANCGFNPSNSSDTSFEQQLSSLETRVKDLEYENSRIRQELNGLKKLVGVVDTNVVGEDRHSRGKLIVRIDDKLVVIDADLQEPIAAIKQRVEKVENIESEEMIVFLANRELDDKKTLKDYRIFKLHNPLLLFMVKKKITISVKIDREKSYSMEMSPKDTVADVLSKILMKEAFNSKNLVLCYRNQTLDEKRTLFSYKIRDGNYVFLNTTEEVNQRQLKS